MDKTQGLNENRREHMRVKARLHFCVSVIEGINHETNSYTYGNCFCTTSSDISLGGMCFSHNGKVNVGFDVEITTPEKMIKNACMTCEKAYLYKNELELQPIRGKVVWATKDRCGVEFIKLSTRNENILSKYIWEEHLNTVRTKKEQVIRQRRF